MTTKEDHSNGDFETPEFTLSHALIEGHALKNEEIKFTIGPYKIIKTIGVGGMGEVYLAYDTICGRRIALKRIKEELLDYKRINNRFLKEAHVTSQLTHPSIIPIYAIHKEGSKVFYTMPFVEGETLKQILKKTRLLAKKGKKVDSVGGSIPSLIRIFISVCQAIAYSHSKKVLHRDLKPENIIVGQYGEVLILDWGLAKLIRKSPNDSEEYEEEVPEQNKGVSLSGITKIGKVVGTVNYMAPERARGDTSTYQTDIYSLGVILFQILTLRYPFIRKSLDDFRKTMSEEVIPDPIEMAPYRDVPRLLARVAVKCLEPDPQDRYSSVDELIRELENYIEGKAEWYQIATLDPKNKSDWEFQEHIYLQDHLAITRTTDNSYWMNLMISKASFSENIMLEAHVRFEDTGHGLGFLLSVPEKSERKHLNDGYCLWISTDIHKSTKLMRSTVEVIHAPEVALTRNEWYHVRIDKIDNIIHFYLNNKLQFSYISHTPLVGTHIGLISRDFDFEVQDFNVYIGGQSINVKCLAVPDAFLAHKDYDTALSEYRRIGYSFPGRAEGREALFRAGITLLEQAKSQKSQEEAKVFYKQALKEFEKLYQTPGAPLEYLGKALVYQALKEYDEEIKCFELGSRRYPKHPLLPVLQEQIIFRMHESSRVHRKATYQFILLTTRLFHEVTLSRHAKKLFNSLQKHWEPLPFIEEDQCISTNINNKIQQFSIKLAFWLGKPYTIEEIIKENTHFKNPNPTLLANGLIAIIKLGSWELAEKVLEEILSADNNPFKESQNLIDDLQFILTAEKNLNASEVEKYINSKTYFDYSSERALLHVMELALTHNSPKVSHTIYNKTKKLISEKNKILFESIAVKGYFLEKNWEEGSKILLKHPIEDLCQESSILHMLYGCWLLVSEGKEIASIHFSGVLETSYPRTWCLLGQYLTRKVHQNEAWLEKAFHWEKRELYKQLQLYYTCIDDESQKAKYADLETAEQIVTS
ncbi:MAG: serine/threonine-protein kinase PknD [Chlamydiota bacterium]|nr:serine/threonine-protein kinase PknD [Chlamydiota bacterium]